MSSKTTSSRGVRRRIGLLGMAVCVLGAAADGLIAEPGPLPEAARELRRLAAQNEADGGGESRLMRHPMMNPMMGGMPATTGGSASSARGGVVPVEPQPPLATGGFVNFESPPVKALALSADGTRLFATNTPNNSLLVLDTTASPMARLNEIAVGLDPVTAAVQPNTNDELVWVANFISDNVSVVNVGLGTVVAVVEVGDEPVNILFDPTGAFAFVVLQGTANSDLNAGIVQEGALVAIDTASRQVVGHVFLDCNKPRAAVLDPVTGQVVVAAVHSGNNTTVVGRPVQFALAGGGVSFLPLLAVPQLFSQTSAVFAASPVLSPWPDVHSDPNLNPGPLVERIIPDVGGDWAQIVDILSIPDGSGGLIPDPAMVTLMNQEFAITNAFDVITEVIDDAKDTLDHDLVVVDVSDPAGVGLSIVNQLGGVGTSLTGMGINASGEIFVSNLEALNTVRLEPNLNGHFIDHQVVIVINPQSPGALIVPTDLHDGIPNFNDVSGPNPLAQQLSLANPTDIVFDDAGATAYVAALGVGRVAALNGVTASVVGRIDVDRGPRSLALDSPGNLLYVFNRTDMSIDRIDVSDPANMTKVDRFAVFNPEPKVIKGGRDFLYSARFAHNFASSCALCHIDGTLDQMAWDLGDPIGGLQPAPPNLTGLSNHPLKGPMVTLSLQGLENHEPLHWRADKPVFQDFNGAFAGLLGGTQLSTEDMDAYAAFVKTITYGPNPFRNRDDSFKDPNAQAGLPQFLASCDACHQVNHGGALAGPNGDEGIVLTGGAIFAQLQLVTQLRGIHKKFRSDVYNGFGLIHDGREERETNLPDVNCPGGQTVPACTNHPLCTFIREFFQNFYCTPGLVDPHTHLIYAGDRSDEVAARSRGERYTGGGILRTVAATSQATDDDLVEETRRRLLTARAQGTTTIEVKSGYGLEADLELRLLRLIDRAAAGLPLRLRRTYLGAHAIPAGSTAQEQADAVIEALPQVAAEADYIDVFSEPALFDLETTRRIAEAGAEQGLRLKLHAEQLERSGAALLGARLSALSVDHLEQLSDADARIIAATTTAATILPGPALMLRAGTPPVRTLLQSGAVVAIGSDANAGTFGEPSMPLAIGLAVALGFPVEEALWAATAGAARALGLSGTVGSLTPGAAADVVAWDTEHEGS
ncbi:MAG: imidazolonepropionase, partial [Phycisphaerae bacterium]